MSTISDLHKEWSETLSTQSAKKQALENERKPLQTELDDFDKGAPTGLWGKLKHQMAKNVGLSPLRDKIGKIDTRIGNARYTITQKAKDTHEHLANYAFSMPSIAPIRAEKAEEERLLAIITSGYAATQETIEACESASAQEWIDVRAESQQQQATSFLMTKRAKQMLRDLTPKLKNMAAQASAVRIPGQASFDEGALQVNLEVNLEQALFAHTSVNPNELSKRNAIGLSSAASALKPTLNSLKSVMQSLQNDIDSATGKAIGIARSLDPEIDALANSIAAHLPSDMSSRMQRRAPPSGPRP